MGYYVYPVYVLASLIILILSIICVIYSLHFYKFVKSRVVFIKLESDVALNTWTFDLYPFTSSRIWKVFGYAIVCLPATFQQASTILVCQCKVIKFKTVLPKTVCDDTTGMVTPILQKREFTSKPCEKTSPLVRDSTSKPLKNLCANCEKPINEVIEEDEDFLENEDNGNSLDLETTPLNHAEKIRSSSNVSNGPHSLVEQSSTTTDDMLSDSEVVEGNSLLEKQENSTSATLHTTTNNNKLPCCDKKSRFQRITQRLRRQSRHETRDTVVNIDPELTEHNMSIMSIDNSFDTDYFIIPEANPLQQHQHHQQTLVLFDQPFNCSCPICLDDFELDEEIALLTCHHGYHKDCLNKALRQNASCPYCKSESNVRAFKVSEEIPLLWQSMSRRNSHAVNV